MRRPHSHALLPPGRDMLPLSKSDSHASAPAAQATSRASRAMPLTTTRSASPSRLCCTGGRGATRATPAGTPAPPPPSPRRATPRWSYSASHVGGSPARMPRGRRRHASCRCVPCPSLPRPSPPSLAHLALTAPSLCAARIPQVASAAFQSRHHRDRPRAHRGRGARGGASAQEEAQVEDAPRVRPHTTNLGLHAFIWSNTHAPRASHILAGASSSNGPG